MIAAEIRIEPMSQIEAERETEFLRKSFNDCRRRIKSFDDRRGWEAMGHSSFSHWARSQFGVTASRIFQILNAAKIEEHISEALSTRVDKQNFMCLPEGVLRPMVRLLKKEDAGAAISAVVDRVLEEADGKLTGPAVKAVVDEMFPRESSATSPGGRNSPAVVAADGAEKPSVVDGPTRIGPSPQPNAALYIPPENPPSPPESDGDPEEPGGLVSADGWFDGDRAIAPAAGLIRDLMARTPKCYHPDIFSCLETFVDSLAAEIGIAWRLQPEESNCDGE